MSTSPTSLTLHITRDESVDLVALAGFSDPVDLVDFVASIDLVDLVGHLGRIGRVGLVVFANISDPLNLFTVSPL